MYNACDDYVHMRSISEMTLSSHHRIWHGSMWAASNLDCSVFDIDFDTDREKYGITADSTYLESTDYPRDEYLIMNLLFH